MTLTKKKNQILNLHSNTINVFTINFRPSSYFILLQTFQIQQMTWGRCLLDFQVTYILHNTHSWN